MATIRFHGQHWQARVRRKGFPEATATFSSRQQAQRWAREIEADMDCGTYRALDKSHHVTLGALINRYIHDVLPRLKGAKEDGIRLKAVTRRSICDFSMENLSASHIAKYRDERLTQVASGTVVRELTYLSSIINHARREWGLTAANPVSLVRKPPSANPRTRILTQDEQTALFSQLAPVGRRNPLMLALVQLAIETAMRRSELLALRWQDINLPSQTATLHTSKNGQGRVVPLSSTGVGILSALPKMSNDKVFPISGVAASAGFKKAAARAGLQNIRFHDLRHTGITSMAQKLPNVIELASVSGHKSLKMLQRYYHPDATLLAKKLG
jgi:integrase